MEALSMAKADPQTLLWQHLKDAPRELEFLRDHEAEGFTLPFYCAAAHLAIEVDDDPFRANETGARERCPAQCRRSGRGDPRHRHPPQGTVCEIAPERQWRRRGRIR
jgi:hypothetical protein